VAVVSVSPAREGVKSSCHPRAKARVAASLPFQHESTFRVWMYLSASARANKLVDQRQWSLARSLRLSTRTLQYAIAELEESGFVERVPLPRGGRAYRMLVDLMDWNTFGGIPESAGRLPRRAQAPLALVPREPSPVPTTTQPAGSVSGATVSVTTSGPVVEVSAVGTSPDPGDSPHPHAGAPRAPWCGGVAHHGARRTIFPCTRTEYAEGGDARAPARVETPPPLLHCKQRLRTLALRKTRTSSQLVPGRWRSSVERPVRDSDRPEPTPRI
jgi:hypothetical protein